MINSGTIDASASYKFSLQNAVELQAQVAKVAVSDVTIRPKNSETDWITVPSLLLNGTTLDLAKRQAHADSLSITGAKLVTWLEPVGSFNLLKLAQPAAGPAPAPASAPATQAPATATPAAVAPAPPASAAGPPWSFELGEFALVEASISTEDRGTSPAVKLQLAPLSVKVRGVSLDFSEGRDRGPRHTDQ